MPAANKRTAEAAPQQPPAKKRGRGRPPKQREEEKEGEEPAPAPEPAPKRRGRPKGSKNKQQAAPQAAAQAAAADPDVDEAIQANPDHPNPDGEFVRSRVPARIAPNDDALTAADISTAERFGQWYASLRPALSPKTVEGYVSHYNAKLIKMKEEFGTPQMSMLTFIKTHLNDMLEKTKNSGYALNSKKTFLGFLLNFIDHFPLLRNDEIFQEGEAMRNLRVLNGVLKEKATEQTLLRGENIYYPLTSIVKERIRNLQLPMHRLLGLILLEIPSRNDMNLYYSDTPQKGGDKNYLYIPNDETKRCEIKLNSFKTQNIGERFETNFEVTEELDAEIRNYAAANRKGKQNEPVFYPDKNSMSKLSADLVQKIGYQYLDGGHNFFRRLAVSNLWYEVEQGRKTLEDKIVLARRMQHSVEAAEKNYRFGVNDGSYLGKRGQTVLCNRIQHCIAENAEVISDILGQGTGPHEGEEE